MLGTTGLSIGISSQTIQSFQFSGGDEMAKSTWRKAFGIFLAVLGLMVVFQGASMHPWITEEVPYSGYFETSSWVAFGLGILFASVCLVKM